MGHCSLKNKRFTHCLLNHKIDPKIRPWKKSRPPCGSTGGASNSRSRLSPAGGHRLLCELLALRRLFLNNHSFCFSLAVCSYFFPNSWFYFVFSSSSLPLPSLFPLPFSPCFLLSTL